MQNKHVPFAGIRRTFTNLRSNTQDLGNARVEAISVVVPWVLAVKHSEEAEHFLLDFPPPSPGRLSFSSFSFPCGFGMLRTRAAGFWLDRGQTRGELSACLYVPGVQPLYVTADTLALLYLKLRKGAAGEKG